MRTRLGLFIALAAMVACGCGDDGGGFAPEGVGRDDGAVGWEVPAPGDPEPAPPPEDISVVRVRGGRPGLGLPNEEPLQPPAAVADPGPPGGVEEPGGHLGERARLEVEIAFSRESGETVADEDGILYRFDDQEIREDRVYPSRYWGTYPLYFFGAEVGVTVTVRNNGPRRKAKLRVRAEACVLLTDGTNGAALCEPSEFDVEVARGETVVIDASFTAVWSEGAESGLDRFVVKVLHPNSGREDASLIMAREGVFCPPEYRP
jgi:hypothetical protein